ncbi:MAG: hypothetical protein R2715_17640 [Ilumatobacteraceae bacterium]
MTDRPDPDFARQVWLRIETVHAVTYFDPAPVEAGRALGSAGFWQTYFGMRAAPLGSVGPTMVDASFANFAPSFVRRWVPGAWVVAEPPAWVAARSASAVEALTRIDDADVRRATSVNELLEAVSSAADPCGRVLFAANQDLELPDEPVARLWQVCTNLREHRGDGHVAAYVAEGLCGLDAHVLLAASGAGTTAVDLQRGARGWTVDDWERASSALSERGLLETRPAGEILTEAGRSVRDRIELATDRAASAPWAAVPARAGQRVLAELTPLAAAIAGSGVIRFPNPISLPPLAPT